MYLTNNVEYRIKETEDRIGKPGNQDNRMQVIRITGNQEKPPRCPNNLMPTTWSSGFLMASCNAGNVSRYGNDVSFTCSTLVESSL
jgi:hypothetical protein